LAPVITTASKATTTTTTQAAIDRPAIFESRKYAVKTVGNL
jgi:hypothetical protein